MIEAAFPANWSRSVERSLIRRVVDTLEIGYAVVVVLLHCNRDVCVPGNVNLVANLDLIEHSRINDTPAVFPSVRTSKGDRRCALVDSGDGCGHRPLLGRRAPRSLPLPRGGGAGRRIDLGLARLLQSR